LKDYFFPYVNEGSRRRDTLTLKKPKAALDNKKRELVQQNIYLVKLIASKIAIFLPKHIDYEDLLHEGLIGLMDAAIKFNSSLGMKFSSYAVIRIKGSILDSLRSLDWIPRRVRKISKKIEKIREDMQQVLLREPTEEEIAKELDISVDKLREIISDVDQSQVLSFEELQSFTSRYFVSEDKLTSVSPTSGISDFERVELKEHLKISLKELSERERLVLSLYYVEDLTLKEIKYILDISEARISQIHTSAIKKLRTSLNIPTPQKAGKS
jgi:RNA polymerase sigma factor for flagellar operon FliA